MLWALFGMRAILQTQVRLAHTSQKLSSGGRGQEETHLAVLETGLQKIFLPTWSAKILFLTSPCEDKRALMFMMQIENEEITGER